MEVKVLQNILSANDQIADRNRQLLDGQRVLAVNIMSSPGAGKTSLILRTIEKLRDRTRIAVIEGDIASTVDADRVSKEGVTALQINTGGSCHLDANMMSIALNNLALKEVDLLLVENVGNLVCPAEFKIGEHKRIMLLSIPEGDDKPYKYPLMFTETEAIVINKIDFLPFVDFDFASFQRAVRGLNPNIKIFRVSCRTSEGIEEWTSWLESQLAAVTAK